VWDALSGEEELTLQHKHIVKSVNFSNDSAALATGFSTWNSRVSLSSSLRDTPEELSR